ncbi:acetophenone carboxylase gamma subunit [Variibacter gotjawalensis]|uniref:Acetophenone carboxylase gamma subunit n=1 Tax=Variibacter gotjawalensis TaxID=1333996 RepID=A0A0S3PU40_9BRAD|nr:hydantoinase/oxoprolinase family protein [Variibacter gotjawalensis]NIK49727.1 N-methylhydantoinase A [Variibacter gotjawalensis]RZS45737.1 N-methylhydantoinase A [Variibacter gotjawalensis]BAT59410.1 acetophenone carboxylase gamma subunit [Variibacter gotjawalensis]
MSYRIAIDIGGTFTDGVIENVKTGEVRLAKRLTTQSDPGQALADVVDDLLSATNAANGKGKPAALVSEVVHGSTLVTNALIERKGVKTALIATEGTGDIIDIGREVRYDLYDLDIQMPKPLVERGERFELNERVATDGRILVAPSQEDIDGVVEKVRQSGAQSVAVAFLHACVNPDNEIRVGEALRKALPNVAVSLSSRVAREIREYERTTTATANAFVQPIVAKYLNELSARLRQAGIDAPLRIMVSSGGSTSAGNAAEVPITTLESGPAGGVLSAANAGRAAGFDDVLAFDMGGTTAKICTVIGGAPSVVHSFEAARVKRFKKGSGLPLLIASIDLIEIGAGGGSIARISDLGLLTVGPDSASADPGPACYGRGGQGATVTDADLTLGYLNPDFFLGGRMSLDASAAEAALQRLGDRLSLAAREVATGIFNVVNEAMAGAARVHIAEKAQDPRRFTMVATGGAGPVHAVEIARKLRVPRVLFPIAAGTGSCLGFLAAPIRVDRSLSKPTRLEAVDWVETDTAVSALKRDAEKELNETLTGPAEVTWQLLVEMRYVGQGANLTVSFPLRKLDATFAPDLEAEFRKSYEINYGGVLPSGTLELVTWRIVGATRQGVKHFAWPHGTAEATITPKAKREIFCTDKGEMASVSVYDRYALAGGARLKGPLILEESESTVVVPIAADVEVLSDLSVLVRLGA